VHFCTERLDKANLIDSKPVNQRVNRFQLARLWFTRVRARPGIRDDECGCENRSPDSMGVGPGGAVVDRGPPRVIRRGRGG